MIEIGDELEEDVDNGMIRSTELGGRERSRIGMNVKKQEKRVRVDMEEGSKKKQKVSEEQVKVLVSKPERNRWGGKKSLKGNRDIRKIESR